MKPETRSSNLKPLPPVVTVFGSSRLLPDDTEYQTAYELGSTLAQAGYTISNGGYGGSMEASAKGAKNSGGETIGVITTMFGATANPYITKTIVTTTHIERLLKLVELGNAYVVLKGSTGTLLELAFVWEYLNKGVIKNKPIIVVGDFWSSVINTLKNELAWEGLLSASQHVSIVGTPQECVEALNFKLKRK